MVAGVVARVLATGVTVIMSVVVMMVVVRMGKWWLGEASVIPIIKYMR